MNRELNCATSSNRADLKLHSRLSTRRINGCLHPHQLKRFHQSKLQASTSASANWSVTQLDYSAQPSHTVLASTGSALISQLKRTTRFQIRISPSQLDRLSARNYFHSAWVREYQLKYHISTFALSRRISILESNRELDRTLARLIHEALVYDLSTRLELE